VLQEMAAEKGYLAGVAPADPSPSADRLRTWLASGMHGEMAWMEKDPQRRTNPGTVVPGARSQIAFSTSYRGEEPLPDDVVAGELRGRVARYAWNRDYHDVLTRELREISARLDAEAGVEGNRTWVDTGPVLERDVAARAGLGFASKNTNLIRPGEGSFLFLGATVTRAELPPTPSAHRPGCGSCQICLDACPTKAIVAPNVVDARLCISYLTIELKGPIPRHLRRAVGDWIFGCDICQDVCPFNAIPRPRARREFRAPSREDMAPSLLTLLALDEDRFRARFRGTPLARPKRRGILRNVAVALGNHRDPRAIHGLVNALSDVEPLVRGHAAWALGEIDDASARGVLDAARSREPDAYVREEIEAALSSGAGRP
ncbi:MAG TPA: tRNA epoxyqueuosine(34) reductase QueG, partial [bacterium]|nr:tRNA epoxyqueuosine(34) reductase QueG [bacterium]